jgi:hypothetical protein
MKVVAVVVRSSLSDQWKLTKAGHFFVGIGKNGNVWKALSYAALVTAFKTPIQVMQGLLALYHFSIRLVEATFQSLDENVDVG